MYEQFRAKEAQMTNWWKIMFGYYLDKQKWGEKISCCFPIKKEKKSFIATLLDGELDSVTSSTVSTGGG